MKRNALALLLAGATLLVASIVPGPADAKITEGTTTQVNGGGNTPNGEANGVPTETTPATNPQGHAPPGQN